MKHKKDFFGVFFSVIISVALIGIGVYAASTIGDDINIGDDLIITGNGLTFGNGASFSNSNADTMTLTESYFAIVGTVDISKDLIIQDTIHVGGTASDDLAYSRIGTGTTGHSLAANTDLLITGKLEVDGNAFFDGTVSISSSGILLDNGATIVTGIASPSGASGGGCVLGSLFIDTVAGTIHLCDGISTYSLITTE